MPINPSCWPWARGRSNRAAQKVLIVHGEPQSAQALADKFRGEHFADVMLPVRGQTVTF